MSKLLPVGLSAITVWFQRHYVPVDTVKVEEPGSELVWAQVSVSPGRGISEGLMGKVVFKLQRNLLC